MDDYDVVIDALEKRRDILQAMTDQNMTSEIINLNIMDDIRLRQIEQLNFAISAYKRKNEPLRREWIGLTVSELNDIFSSCLKQEKGYIAAMVESLLRDKNA